MSFSAAPASQRTSLLRTIMEHILIIGGFALLSLLLTYPLVGAPPNTIVGTRIAQKDGWQTVWDLWWFGTALRAGENPLWTRHIFWPGGVDLQVYEAYGLSTLVQSLPVLLPWGPVAAYRWNMVVNFTLSGYALALVARTYTHQWWPAVIAGVIFTASPFHLSRFADGYDDLTALQWLPLYVLVLDRWLRGAHWRYGVGALVLLLVIYFTALYYMQFALVWTAAAWAVYSVVTRAPMRTAVRVVCVLGGWALLCAPLLARSFGTEITYGDYLTRQETHSVDLLDLLLPSDIHPLWRRFDPHRVTHLYGSWNVVPGIAVLLVGGYGLWRTRRTTWPLMVLALMMLVFAMGPTLYVAGTRTGVPLPHRLLNLSSLGQASQRPNHFFVFAIVVLSLGIALALRGRSRATMLAAGLAVFAVDCVPPLPWPAITGTPPPFLQVLDAEREGALLELPVRSREIDYQFSQLWHGRPITGGYVSRVPPDPIIDIPILEQLSGEAAPTVVGGDERTQLLVATGASCASIMVVHGDRQPAVPLAVTAQRIATLLPEAQQLADGDPLIYRIPSDVRAPLVLPGRGWYDLEYDAERRWQWTAPDSTFEIVNPFAVRITAQLAVTLEGVGEPRLVQLADERATLWQERLAPGVRQRLAVVRLEAHERRIFHLRAEPTEEAGGSERTLGVVVREIRATFVDSAERFGVCPPDTTLPAALTQP